jgi:hypothetical protein
MAGRVRGVFGPTDDPIELLERLPAGGQGGVVADDAAANAAFVALVEENAAAVDAFIASAVLLASVSERVGAVDAIIGRLLWEIINDSQGVSWQNVNTSETTNWQVINTADGTQWQVINTLP